MHYRSFFVKTLREAPKGEESRNAQLLIRAGMVDKTMAGVYNYLPLGLAIVRKIEAVVREEMLKAGAAELLMPALHPKRIWEENGRWEILGDIMYQFKDKSGSDVGLGTTHEEVIVDMARKRIKSWRDLPVALFQIQTKFRNEPRPKSGVLRGREFIMKDLYSFHATVDDLNSYYDQMKAVYLRIYERLGVPVKMVEASGGTFTTEYSHEFQVLTSIGEDTIYHCNKCDFAQNNEIAKVEEDQTCPNDCGGKIIKSNGIEVGNIFRFFEKYGTEMKITYTDKDSRVMPVLLCSYGIGITRLFGTIAELNHDEKGLILPKVIAPYQVVIVSLPNKMAEAQAIYEKLLELGVEAIIDDRAEASLGEKMTDADLIGWPYKVIVGNQYSGINEIEVVERVSGQSAVMSCQELANKCSE